MKPEDRIRSDLEKLRAIQPNLTREHALTFFRKFHPAYSEAAVVECLDQVEFGSNVEQPHAETLDRSVAPKAVPSPPPIGALGSPRTSQAAKRARGSRRGARADSTNRKMQQKTPSQPAGKPICPECGKPVQLAKGGRVRPHRGADGGHACLGAGRRAVSPNAPITVAEAAAESRRAEFTDTTGVPQGELAPSDREWIDDSGWLIPLAHARPSDVVKARRILLAANNGLVPDGTARSVHRWYQDMKSRPDLFNPKKKPSRWLDVVEAVPEARESHPAAPKRNVYYREVLVAKRN